MKSRKTVKVSIIVGLCILLIFSLNQIFCLFFISQSFKPLKSIYAPDSKDFIKEHRPVYTGNDEVELFYQEEKDRCYPLLKSLSRQVSTKSFDGLNLNAYLALHPQNHNYAILMHGFRDSPKITSPYAMHFFENGFNVLVPGQRGHGWSEGNIIDMSAFTPNDVKSWIEFLCDFDSEAKIALWGISMGASTVMQTLGFALPKNVVCCIEDCGFSSAWDEFSHQLTYFYHLPVHPLLDSANIYLKHHLKIDTKKVSAKAALTRAKIPTLFIHGSADEYVPFYMLDIVFDAAACPKEKLVIEGAQHARSAFTAPKEYWEAVDTFLGKWF